jgi:hypothetical protein
MEENKLIEPKAPKKKQGLDFQQAVLVQQLVIKKFKKVKKDIVREEDVSTVAQLCALLA